MGVYIKNMEKPKNCAECPFKRDGECLARVEVDDFDSYRQLYGHCPLLEGEPMRLIDRKKALSHPFANGKYDHKNANRDFIRGFESYKEWLEQLSAIDLVRCGECKYFDYDDAVCRRPKKLSFIAEPTDFCSYGERRADEGATE